MVTGIGSHSLVRGCCKIVSLSLSFFLAKHKKLKEIKKATCIDRAQAIIIKGRSTFRKTLLNDTNKNLREKNSPGLS